MRFSKKDIINGFKDLYGRHKLKFVPGHENFINRFFDEIDVDPAWKNVQQLAYFLASVMHETNFTFAPVKEKRAKEGTNLFTIQNRYWLPGTDEEGFWAGKGHIQLTWKDNYIKMGRKLGIPLHENPDLALDFRTSYLIASIGCREGLFSGKSLSDYINDSKVDYYNARRVVNGLDKAEKIASYAKEIEGILKASYEEEFIELRHTNPLSKPVEPQQPEIAEIPTMNEEISKTEKISLTDAEGPSVAIEAVKAVLPKGWQTVKTVIISILSSFSLAAGSIFGWFQERFNDSLTAKIFLIAGILIIVFAFVYVIIYLITRHKLIRERERQAHELTLKQLEIRSDPERFNVEVRNS